MKHRGTAAQPHRARTARHEMGDEPRVAVNVMGDETQLELALLQGVT